jgi:hypothetical protein
MHAGNSLHMRNSGVIWGHDVSPGPAVCKSVPDWVAM